MAIVFCGSKTKEIMTDLPFSRVLKVFLHLGQRGSLASQGAITGEVWQSGATSRLDFCEGGPMPPLNFRKGGPNFKSVTYFNIQRK